MHLYDESLESMGTVRRPIQCEGITRGPERIAEIATSGGVSPQFDWGGLAKQLIPVAMSYL
jgi:hypothetical protein